MTVLKINKVYSKNTNVTKMLKLTTDKNSVYSC